MYTNSFFVIDKEGHVWGTGDNKYGQLGVGDTSPRYTFVKISNERFKFVTSNENNTVLIHEDGSLWGMGINNNYALGTGDSSPVVTTLKMLDKGPYVHAAVTKDCTLAVTPEGKLFGSGYTASGTLGFPSKANINTFEPIVFSNGNDILFDKVYISNSGVYAFAMAIGKDKSVYSWGHSSNYDYSPASTANTFTYEPIKISLPDDTQAKKIAISGYSNVVTIISILSEDGRVFGRGNVTDNNRFVNGLSVFTPTFTQVTQTIGNKKIIDIDLSFRNGIAISDQGEVFTCGYNNTGLTLNGTITNDYTQTFSQKTNISKKIKSASIGTNGMVLLSEDGGVYTAGTMQFMGINSSRDANVANLYKANIEIDKSVKFTKSECTGGYTRISLSEDGYIYSSGSNSSGEGGNGTTLTIPLNTRVTLEKFSDISTGYAHSLAIHKETKDLWATGYNIYFAFSPEASLENQKALQFKKVLDGPIKKAIGTVYGTFALKENGTLLYIGQNAYGEFGNGSTTPIKEYTQVGNAEEWEDIFAHYVTNQCQIFIGVKKDGCTYVWGTNIGKVIDSSKSTSVIYPITKIADFPVINAFVFANSGLLLVSEEHEVYVLGGITNTYIGSSAAISVGSTLTKLSIKNLDNVVDIRMTDSSALILKTDGSVWGAGNNNYNELDTTIDPRGGFYKIFDEGKIKNIFSTYKAFGVVLNDGRIQMSGNNDFNVFGYNTNISNLTFNLDKYLQFPLSIANHIDEGNRVYDTSKEFSAVLAGYVGYRINSLEPLDSVPENTGLRYAFSKDGTTWNVYKDGAWKTIEKDALKTGGMTSEEIKSLTKDEWEDYSFSEIRIRLTMWTNDEKTSPIFYNMSAYVDVAAQKPDINVGEMKYNVSKMIYPNVSVSTDGSTWNEAKVDELNEVNGENTGLQVKLDLSQEDEVDAISYSWN